MINENETMQDKTGRLVNQEVYSCVTSMVEYILQKSWEDENAPFNNEDIENMYAPDYSDMDESDLDDINEDYHGEDFTDYDFEDKVEYLTDNYEDSEIFEWWMVSGWLAQKLADMGECVILGDNIWGRKTTGQAIKMDGIIHRLVVDLGW